MYVIVFKSIYSMLGLYNRLPYNANSYNAPKILKNSDYCFHIMRFIVQRVI